MLKYKYMDANQIVEIVSSVGFPIIMCLILLKYMKQESDEHDKEVQHLTDTINANTKVLTELCTLIKTLIK